jgi:DHA1 family tetracycline resistance protein-like MFS transporter
MGMIGASFGIGFIIGPAIGGLLAPYGYAVPMYAAAALSGLNLLLAIVVLREPSVHRKREGAGDGRFATLRDPFIRRMTILYFLFCTAVTQLEATFAFLMMDRFGYDAREVAGILVLVAVVMASIQGGAIRGLAARYGEARLVFVGATLMTLCFAPIPVSSPIAVLLVPLVLVGIGRAISQPPLLSLVSVAATPANRGVVMGTFQSAGHMARVFGPITAGALYDVAYGLPYYFASATMLGVLVMARALPARAEVAGVREGDGGAAGDPLRTAEPG